MEKNLDILYDHYKDTYSVIKAKSRVRDKFFVFLLALLFIVFLILTSPSIYSQLIGTLSKKYLELNTTNSHFAFIDVFILFLILVCSVKYFQTIIYLDRGYIYIKSCETKLNQLIGEFDINREGKSYLQNYPKFLNSSYIVFSYLVPFILIFVTILYTIRIYQSLFSNTSTKIFSIIIVIMIVSYTILYLQWIIFKR